MNKLIYEIFETIVHNHQKMELADRIITAEIKHLLEPYKEQMTTEEQEVLRNILFCASYCSKREAFAVGFYYAVELLLNNKL